MFSEPASLDPATAWQPFEPTAAEPWNLPRAAHLFRRTGFAASPGDLAEALRDTPAAAVERLFGGTGAESFDRQADQLAATVASSSGAEKLAAAWIHRMIGTPRPLREKMTLFWHGHFATSASKVTSTPLLQRQNDLFRRHALGDFRALVLEVSRDPAMLIYLDSATNRKAHPNENYARELMELFCLGEGNYTEQDVREVARCFTGWGLRRDSFRFNPYEHDRGVKAFLGSSGPFDGEDAVEVVLDQPSASLFIARKLCRWFLIEEPELPDSLVRPLAVEFANSGMNIAVLVRRILASRLFFSSATFGRKIRSPVELVVGLLRSLEGTADANLLAGGMGEIGQALFAPPNVKGWDGGRAWIDSSTLLGRANLVHRILEDGKTRFAGGSLEAFVGRHVSDDPAAQVDWLAGLLLAVPLPEQVRERLITIASNSDQDAERRLRSLLYAMCTLPECQLN